MRRGTLPWVCPLPISSQGEHPGCPAGDPCCRQRKASRLLVPLLRKPSSGKCLGSWLSRPWFQIQMASVCGWLPKRVQPLADSWTSSMMRASGFCMHPTHSGLHRAPPTSYGLSDPQITKECFSLEPTWLRLLLPSSLATHDLINTSPCIHLYSLFTPSLFPQKYSGPFVAHNFPSIINLLVHKRPWYLMVLTQMVLVYQVDARTPPLPLPPRCPFPGSIFLGNHKEGLMRILQKSILMPLEKKQP